MATILQLMVPKRRLFEKVSLERWEVVAAKGSTVYNNLIASFKTNFCCWTEFFFPLLLKIIKNFVLGLIEHSVFRHCSFCAHGLVKLLLMD